MLGGIFVCVLYVRNVRKCIACNRLAYYLQYVTLWLRSGPDVWQMHCCGVSLNTRVEHSHVHTSKGWHHTTGPLGPLSELEQRYYSEPLLFSTDSYVSSWFCLVSEMPDDSPLTCFSPSELLTRQMKTKRRPVIPEWICIMNEARAFFREAGIREGDCFLLSQQLASHHLQSTYAPWSPAPRLPSSSALSRSLSSSLSPLLPLCLHFPRPGICVDGIKALISIYESS